MIRKTANKEVRANLAEPIREGIRSLVEIIIEDQKMRDLQEWGIENGIEMDNNGNISLDSIDVPQLQEIYKGLEILAYGETSGVDSSDDMDDSLGGADDSIEASRKVKAGYSGSYLGNWVSFNQFILELKKENRAMKKATVVSETTIKGNKEDHRRGYFGISFQLLLEEGEYSHNRIGTYKNNVYYDRQETTRVGTLAVYIGNFESQKDAYAVAQKHFKKGTVVYKEESYSASLANYENGRIPCKASADVNTIRESLKKLAPNATPSEIAKTLYEITGKRQAIPMSDGQMGTTGQEDDDGYIYRADISFVVQKGGTIKSFGDEDWLSLFDPSENPSDIAEEIAEWNLDLNKHPQYGGSEDKYAKALKKYVPIYQKAIEKTMKSNLGDRVKAKANLGKEVNATLNYYSEYKNLDEIEEAYIAGEIDEYEATRRLAYGIGMEWDEAVKIVDTWEQVWGNTSQDQPKASVNAAKSTNPLYVLYSRYNPQLGNYYIVGEKLTAKEISYNNKQPSTYGSSRYEGFVTIDELAEAVKKVIEITNTETGHINVRFNGLNVDSEIKNKIQPIFDDIKKKWKKEDINASISNANASFQEKTKQGYEIKKTLTDSTRTQSKNRIIIGYRPRMKDYFIGIGYDAATGEWEQGYYDYETEEEAREFIKKHYQTAK